MSLENKVLEMALDHIHVYESQRGKIKKKDPIGETQSEYHMKVDIAKGYDSSYEGMTQEEFDRTVTPEKERELVRQHLTAEAKRLETQKIDFNVLNDGEQVALLSTIYNIGDQPSTIDAFANLSYARRYNSPGLEDFRTQARNSLNVSKASGKPDMGVMQRTLSHRRTFDGDTDVDSTYEATANFTSDDVANTYQHIKETSEQASVFTSKISKNQIFERAEMYRNMDARKAKPAQTVFTEQPKEVVDIDVFPAPEVIRGDMQ